MRPGGKGKRDTNDIGEISEAAITTRLLQLGYDIFIPYGGNKRYDLMSRMQMESSGGSSAKRRGLTRRIRQLHLIPLITM